MGDGGAFAWLKARLCLLLQVEPPLFDAMLSRQTGRAADGEVRRPRRASLCVAFCCHTCACAARCANAYVAPHARNAGYRSLPRYRLRQADEALTPHPCPQVASTNEAKLATYFSDDTPVGSSIFFYTALEAASSPVAADPEGTPFASEREVKTRLTQLPPGLPLRFRPALPGARRRFAAIGNWRASRRGVGHVYPGRAGKCGCPLHVRAEERSHAEEIGRRLPLFRV